MDLNLLSRIDLVFILKKIEEYALFRDWLDYEQYWWMHSITSEIFFSVAYHKIRGYLASSKFVNEGALGLILIPPKFFVSFSFK